MINLYIFQTDHSRSLSIPVPKSLTIFKTLKSMDINIHQYCNNYPKVNGYVNWPEYGDYFTMYFKASNCTP